MQRYSILGLWLVACSCVILGDSARAQGSPKDPGLHILGLDNVGFARGLYNAGFPDLANDICKALEVAEKGGGGDATEFISVKLLRIDLRIDAARREPDLLTRKNLIAAALKEKIAFISENTRTSTAQEARNDLPETYRLLGETLTAALQQKGLDLAVAGTLRSEGQEIFTQAESTLKERITFFEDRISDPETRDLEYAERQLTVASYNLARTYYYHSLLFAKDDPKKIELLNTAIKAFSEFGLSNGDDLLNYQGLIYQGLCYRDLGQNDDARVAFDDSIAVRETWEKKPNSVVFDMPPEAADIVSGAFVQKILLLTELKDFAGASEAANDYLATTPDALLAAQGLAVLAAQADAQVAAGDAAGAGTTAQKLADADPDGPWGRRAREILGMAIDHIDLGPERMLKIAQSMLGRSEFERAVDVCTQVRDAAKGAAKEQDFGAESYYLEGYAFRQLGLTHEAAIAWDAAVEQYPTGAKAADALWMAVQSYEDLHSQERRPFYKKRKDDRMRLLASQYPKSPFASRAQIVAGNELRDDGKYLEAADAYVKMQPGTAGYEEGQYLAGDCYLRYARTLLASNKAADAKNFFSKSEELLKRTMTGIEKTLQDNLDPEVQARLGDVSFKSLVALAQLYLQAGVDRAADVGPLLKDVEKKYPGDQKKLAFTWGLRIQALVTQGQLDQAVELFESLRQADPDAAGLAAASGVLARALDAAGQKLLEKDPASKEGEEKLSKAAQYYVLSVRPALTDPALARTEEIDDIAERLYAMGMHFNKVPKEFDTFVGWSEEKPKEPMFWEQTAMLYRAMLARAPNYRTTISLGRTLGFLGKWRDAAEVYAKQFDQEKMFDASGKRFNPAIVKDKSGLIFAYLEYGVAERNAVVAEGKHDKASLSRANDIFEKMVANTPETEAATKLFWQARYEWIRCLMDQGDYENADRSVRTIERTTNDFDQGKFGYKDKFLQLKADVAKKVFRKGTPPPTPPPPTKKQ